MSIKQVGTAEVMRQCLAVVTIADHPIYGSGRWIRDRATNFAAAAAQLSWSAHYSPCPERRDGIYSAAIEAGRGARAAFSRASAARISESFISTCSEYR
jgi:hypothetical protein